MKWSKYIIILIILLSILPDIIRKWYYDHGLNEQISESMAAIDPASDQDKEQSGYVSVYGVELPLTEEWIRNYLSRMDTGKKAHYYTWRWGINRVVTASALGLDKRHHFANSYLVDFRPFDTESLWVPLYVLTMKKQYQYDNLQYSGLTDVWQNSRQAYYYTRGDCEDHAIILADWLISQGENARVAVGSWNGGGHAWVILFKNGNEYLLEATSKKKRTTDQFPLAYLKTDYNPTIQFNRSDFWVFTGDYFTTRYSGDHWKKISTFIRTNPKGN